MTEATLSAKVTADIADFNKKFDDLRGSIDGLAKHVESPAAATASAADSIEQSTGRWKTAFFAVGAVVAAGAVTAIQAIGEWTSAAAQAAEQTEHIAQQTGIAAQTLESWSVALNRVGLDTESFSQGFKALSKDIVKAQDAADFSKTKFAEMGLTINQLGNTEQVIRVLADRFAAMPDGAQKAQLAIDLFGRAGLKLIPLLNQGAAGLDAAAQKARDFGLVLDSSARTQLVQYDDALDDLGKAWEGLKTQVAVAAAPILLKAVELTSSAITMAGKILASIQQMVGGVRLAFAQLGDILVGIREKTDAVKGFFKGLYDAVSGRSYIPDMVDDIGRHMQNLDVAMVAPARNATVATGKIFEGLQFTAQSAMNQLVSTLNFGWGSVAQTVGSSLAQMTQGAVNWAAVMTQVGVQVLGQMLTTAIQMAAQWVLSEALRTTATVTANGAILASTLAANGLVLTSHTATAVASTSIWGGASTAILGFFGAVTGGFTALSATLVTAVTSVGTFVMGVLSAIAEALADTIFGIPVAVAIIAGVVAIGVALAATGNLPKLAEGGIVTRPTLALIGEAGPEAVVPLSNRRGRGAGFDSGGSRTIVVPVYLNGHEIARAMVDDLPSALRIAGVPV